MGMLGHDIRNPLGTIRLSAELLTRSGQLSPKAAQPIVNAAKRIQGIVELIIDFSRAQSGSMMPVSVKPARLGPLAESVADETRIRHPSTTLILEGAELDTGCDMDEARMGQVLSNLLENAILYGVRGGTVTIVLSAGDDHVGFSVHNAGRPISQEERGMIFEPRQRGDGSLLEQRSSNGLGLGLYICREIMRSHNGTLAVRSTEAEGTTFLGAPAAPAACGCAHCLLVVEFRGPRAPASLATFTCSHPA